MSTSHFQRKQRQAPATGTPSSWWSGLWMGQEAKSGRKEQHKEESWWSVEGTAGEVQPRCMCVSTSPAPSRGVPWGLGISHTQEEGLI